MVASQEEETPEIYGDYMRACTMSVMYADSEANAKITLVLLGTQ